MYGLWRVSFGGFGVIASVLCGGVVLFGGEKVY